MRRGRDVDNSQDVIDSRDVIARIDELEGERQALQDAIDEAQFELDQAYPENAETLADLNEDLEATKKDLEEWPEADELKALQALAEECEGYGDWEHGETLIRNTYWVQYAQQLAEDLGDMPRDIPDWIVIDWEATAENLKADYMTVEFDGVEYLMRA